MYPKFCPYLSIIIFYLENVTLFAFSYVVVLSMGFLLASIVQEHSAFWPKSLWLSSRAPACRRGKSWGGPLYQFDLFDHSSKHHNWRQPGTSSLAPILSLWWSMVGAASCCGVLTGTWKREAGQSNLRNEGVLTLDLWLIHQHETGCQFKELNIIIFNRRTQHSNRLAHFPYHHS